MYQTFRPGRGRVHPVAVIIHVSPLISRSIFMFKCDHAKIFIMGGRPIA